VRRSISSTVALCALMLFARSASAAVLCVTQPPITWSAGITQNLITFDQCAACTGAAGEPTYCYHDAGAALAASHLGDTVLVDMGTYTVPSGVVLDGVLLIGAGRHRTRLEGSSGATITLKRGRIQGMTVQSTGGTAVQVLYNRNAAQTPDYNATILDSKVIANGTGATALHLSSLPVGWKPDGVTVLDRVHIFLGSADVSSTGLRVEVENTVEARKGIDVVRAPSVANRVIQSTVRVSGAGIGVRRTCTKALQLHAVNLWYVNLFPSPSGRLIKEVAGSGACVPLVFTGLGGIHETSRLEFLLAPNGLAEYRGVAQPFACPGLSGTTNALGSHWTSGAVGSTKVCTSTGWRVLSTL
jgi:hypothetical protein